MKKIIFVLMWWLILSWCTLNQDSTQKDKEISELKQQVEMLNSKIDSLEDDHSIELKRLDFEKEKYEEEKKIIKDKVVQELYDKNKDCQKYFDKMKNTDMQVPFFLDRQIFYSSVLNTCIYSSLWQNPDNINNDNVPKNLLRVLNALTNETIISEWNYHSTLKEFQEKYYSKIKELKWE